MRRIGLTGNIGAGKSTVARLLAERGAVVVDADVLAREAVAPGTPALAAIAARFGDGVLGADGALDRAALRRIVFADAAARADLEAVVHPAVAARREVRAREAAASGATVLVDEIPLLYEVGLGDAFDGVVFVDAPPELRLARLVSHRGLPPDDARAMMAAQGDAALKRARATWVIDNDASLAELSDRVAAVWRAIIALPDPPPTFTPFHDRSHRS